MKAIIPILAFLILAAAGCDTVEPSANSSDPFAASKAGLPGRGTVLRLAGTGSAYAGTVQDIDGDGAEDDATCFDVLLYDSAGNEIGTATDCLSEITPVDGGMALIGTTIFNMPNGTFTTRGHTTVQPITTAVATPITHVTGAIPMGGANGIISGSGAYSNFEAKVRLSGAVNLSELDSDGLITFDCLFAIDPL